MSSPSIRTVVVASALAASVLSSGCKPSLDHGALGVTLHVGSGLKSTCYQIEITPASGTAVKSSSVASKATIDIAVYPAGNLTGQVSLVARGYLDAACTVFNDESAPQTAAFTAGQITPVSLQVNAPDPSVDADGDGYRAQSAGGPDCDDTNRNVNPGVVEICTNHIDDNCNGLTDCADTVQCSGQTCDDGNPCTNGDTCTGTVCQGSAQLCSQPPACRASPGVCVPDAGCIYAVRADAGTPCNDGNLCTSGDTCRANGTCAGTPVACPPPPIVCEGSGTCDATSGACSYPRLDAGTSCNPSNLCILGAACLSNGTCSGTAKTCNTRPGACFALTGTCAPSTGNCNYPVVTTNACSDNKACTFNDTCQADGGCAGTPYSCATPPGECFIQDAGTCLGNGGCTFLVDPARLYTACNGGAGACRTDGSCSPPTFPYAPSNFPPSAIDAGDIAGTITLSCAAVINTDPIAPTPYVSWCGQPQPPVYAFPQAPGPDAMLIPVYALRIPVGGSLTVTGPRSLIFAVFDQADIEGFVSAAATQAAPGAGGSFPGCGTQAGGDATGIASGAGSGGGGAAAATDGAPGGLGNGQSPTTAGPGGVAQGGPTASPLLPGCSGGAGLDSLSNVSGGGGGGGGFQLSAAYGLTVGGIVSASGGGGAGGTAASAAQGGAGGGSGGALLFEADQLSLASTARLTANGGGGGGGGGATTGSPTSGGPGDDGALASATAAAGGTSGSPGGGAGGEGGTSTSGPVTGFDGLSVSGVPGAGGGGGGAVGVIRLNAAATCSVDSQALESPVATSSGCP